MIKGEVVSVNISDRKGISKSPAHEILLKEDLGVSGDAHAAPGDRQVSLLAVESIEAQKNALERLVDSAKCPKGGELLTPGAFAENITTRGIILHKLPLGTSLKIGGALLVVSKIGKECHDHCAIFRKLGDCVMPREGIFGRVIRGGKVRPGDQIIVDQSGDTDGK